MKHLLFLMMILAFLLTACQQTTQPIKNLPTSNLSTPWSDNCAPTKLAHFPQTGTKIPNGNQVVVGVAYNDDCDNPLTGGVSSGINKDNVWFVIVPPRGPILRFEEISDFIELTDSNAKIVISNLIDGVWTVNVYVKDYADNLAGWTWVFRVGN